MATIAAPTNVVGKVVQIAGPAVDCEFPEGQIPEVFTAIRITSEGFDVPTPIDIICEAAQHIGEAATVCGTVAGAHYARATEGQPTFVNLDQPYPNQVFTIVVWGDYRGKFQTPPETWTGHLCATGKISAYRGKVEMKVFGPQQIRH